MEYWIAILIPILAVAVVVICAKGAAAHLFRCKHCGKSFSIPWTKVLVTEHSGDEYRLTCPHCSTKDWCAQEPKE